MMLVLYNTKTMSSNVRNKIREPLNITKAQSHVMLVLHNVRMVPSNVKKIRESPNVTKVRSNVMFVLHNVRIVSSNVKNKK